MEDNEDYGLVLRNEAAAIFITESIIYYTEQEKLVILGKVFSGCFTKKYSKTSSCEKEDLITINDEILFLEEMRVNKLRVSLANRNDEVELHIKGDVVNLKQKFNIEFNVL